METIKPRKIQKIACPKCGELMLKVYPWSSIFAPKDFKASICGRCVNKGRKDGTLKAGVTQ